MVPQVRTTSCVWASCAFAPQQALSKVCDTEGSNAQISGLKTRRKKRPSCAQRWQVTISRQRFTRKCPARTTSIHCHRLTLVVILPTRRGSDLAGPAVVPCMNTCGITGRFASRESHHAGKPVVGRRDDPIATTPDRPRSRTAITPAERLTDCPTFLVVILRALQVSLAPP